MSENSLNKSRLIRRRYTWSFLAVLSVFVAYGLAILFSIVIVQLLALVGLPLGALNSNVANFIGNSLVWAIMLLLIIASLRKWRGAVDINTTLGLSRLPGWSDIPLALVAFLPYAVLSTGLNQLFGVVFPNYNQSEVQQLGFSNFATQYEMMLAFIALIVFAPIVEEIVFRGYLFGRLRKYAGAISATILTSLVFAVLHMQLNVGIDVFALSIMLCLLRSITGSIWAGVLLHMFKNGLAYYVLFVVPMIQ